MNWVLLNKVIVNFTDSSISGEKMVRLKNVMNGSLKKVINFLRKPRHEDKEMNACQTWV